MAALLLACTPAVTDGDTFRCGRERIRLLAIDAPELAGHCRRGRRCVSGDPRRATRSLRQALTRRPLLIRRAGVDRYGRTLAAVSAGGMDLSCHQLRVRSAIYVARWDHAGWIARSCYSQATPSPSRSR
ncbi:MAG: thermonuclease family protein [Sphingobium sp.]|uniref:thermonuclease family protein n=1 Tax=Sphingobium sp. TaxID=1912891 RepID=UPI003BB0F1EA